MIAEEETVELFWEDGINQKGTQEQRNIVIIQHSKSRPLRKSKNWQERREEVTYIPIQVPPREFSYKGPMINHVIKEPLDGWNNETYSEEGTRYSVEYIPKLGQDAIANLKVFVKRKYISNNLVIRSGFEREIIRESQQLNSSDEMIHQHEIVKQIAQNSIDLKHHNLENLNGFQESINDFEKMKSTITAELTQSINAKKSYR